MPRWKKVRGVSRQDIETLHFIWKWKLVPTAVIHAAASPESHHKTTYYRLRALAEQKYVSLQAVGNMSDRFAWMLTPRGFETIAESLPELREVGFKVEALEHDFLVSAIHMGPLITLPEEIEVFTEQELRRLDLELYPSWAPQTEVHRPDGYWRVPQGKKKSLIALEVERFVKGSRNYETVAAFYSDFQNIVIVVWAVPSKSTAHSILAALRKYGASDLEIHHFVTLESIESEGWQAPLLLGHSAGKTVHELLCPGFQPSFPGKKLPFFYSSKTGAIPTASGVSAQVRNSNRVAIPTNLATHTIPQIKTSLNQRSNTCIAKRS